MATLPVIPTSVVGSHGLPSWLMLVREAVQADRLGPADIPEAYDDGSVSPSGIRWRRAWM